MRSFIGGALELEAGIVGAILSDPARLFDLPAGFKAEHLPTPQARRVFTAVQRLSSAGKTADFALVAEEAHLADDERNSLGNYLGCSAGSAAAQYARQLMARRQRESLTATLARAGESLRGETPTKDVVSALTLEVLGLDNPDRPEVYSYTESALEALEAFSAEHSGKSQALKTGLPDLDKRVRIWPGNVVVIAARASLGKSTVALNIASFVARHTGPVLFHSLEMSRVELIARDLSSAGAIPLESIFGTSIAQTHSDRLLLEAQKRSESSKLLINDSHFDIGSVVRITEKTHRKSPLALVVVDYLQLIESDQPKAQREAQVSSVSRALKKMAMGMSVPVLAVSQLNREPERRAERMVKPRRKAGEAPPPEARLPSPKLSDLRESGAIEQDANTVLILHHPWAESSEEGKRIRGPYELIIAKQRNGRKGSVRLRAELEYARFVSYLETESQPAVSFYEGGKE